MVTGHDFVNASSPERIAELVRSEFLSSYPMETGVDKDDIWISNNLITEDGFARLTGIVKDGQIPADDLARVPYDKSVDMSLVKKERGIWWPQRL
jgi:hypothetical protein